MAAAARSGHGSQRSPGATPGSRTSRPLDLTQLTRQTMGDRALEREVLALFVKQALTVRDRLADADPAERRYMAHSLKGSARSVGAYAMADCLAEIEANPQASAAIKRLPVLIDALRDFVAAIHR